MGMQKADETVAQLVVDISDKQRILDAVTHLQSTYPDLLVDRNSNITSYHSAKFCSSGANYIAEDVEIVTRMDVEYVDQHPDITLEREIIEAWPYTTVDGYKVYSIPGSFEIGYTNTAGFGTIPIENWEDKMDGSKIALAAIRKARAYLKKNPPITY